MHEAGLARAIAAELRERSLAVGDVRLLVRGGYDVLDAFDAALQTHLALEMPGGAEIEIIHVPAPRFCMACGGPFEAVDAADRCPVCGGTSLPVHGHETVEIETR